MEAIHLKSPVAIGVNIKDKRFHNVQTFFNVPILKNLDMLKLLF